MNFLFYALFLIEFCSGLRCREEKGRIKELVREKRELRRELDELKAEKGRFYSEYMDEIDELNTTNSELIRENKDLKRKLEDALRVEKKDGVSCQYDLIVAIDLDCVKEQETPVMQTFARELVSAIFANKLYVERGYIRVGIIGFHNSLHIGMPLCEMSFVKNQQNEVGYNNALKAINTLISIAQNQANQESASFTQMFSLIPTLFDARNHSRQLIIITNASPGIRYPGWSKYALEDLSRMRQELYGNIQITAVAVSAEQCRGNYGTWTEDCFFADALMRIDPSFNTRRTLIGARQEQWSSFYQGMVSHMLEDIRVIEAEMKCEPAAVNPIPCACAACAELGPAGLSGRPAE